MQNNVYIPFTVSALEIFLQDTRPIPSGNQKYIYARFTFAPSWDGLNKTAIFARDGLDTVHEPIVDDVVQIPDDFMREHGSISVSVFAGERRTVNSAIVTVSRSGYEGGTPPHPPAPGYEYVKTPGGSVTLIRENDAEAFQYYARGDWHTVEGGGGSDSDIAWLPNVDEDSNISWSRSSTTTPPTPRNIRGQDGKDGVDGRDALINGMNVLEVVGGHNTAAVVDTVNKTLRIDATMPAHSVDLMFFATEDGAPVATHTVPTTPQTILPSGSYFPANPGVWHDIRRFTLAADLDGVELEFIPGNSFTAKLWIRSDMARDGAQFRLRAIDARTDTALATGTASVDLGQTGALQPVIINGLYETPAVVPAENVEMTLQVLTPLFGVQLGIFSIPPDELSYLSRLISGTAVPGPAGEDGKSAFEFAVEGGYAGTEQQFYYDLGAVGGLADAIMAIVGGAA